MRRYLVEAIRELRPGSEFVIRDNDYSTIEWIVLEGKAPTLKQVEEAIITVQEKEAQQAAENAARRAAILERLGLTEDEAKLILS